LHTVFRESSSKIFTNNTLILGFNLNIYIEDKHNPEDSP